MQQSEWISRELHWVKKANLQKLHTVWPHLYNIFEMKNCSDEKL